MDIFLLLCRRIFSFTNEMLILCSLFFWYCPRREHFWLRYLLSVFVYVFVFAIYPSETWLMDHMMTGWFNWSFFPMYFGLVLIFVISFKASWKEILFFSLASWNIQHLISLMLESVTVLAGFERRTWPYYLILFVFDIAAFVFTKFVLVDRAIKKERVRINSTPLLFASTLAFLIINILSQVRFIYIDNVYAPHILLCYGYEIAGCLLALALMFNLFGESITQREKEGLERFIALQQKANYQSNQTMDLLGIKYHDLKKELLRIENAADKGDQEQILKELREAVRKFESYYNTGNKSLDTLLSQKKFLIDKFGIRFTCMADGAALFFIFSMDLNSLIGNALDNAIERECREPEGKRVIAMKVAVEDGRVFIRIENYCSSPVRFGKNGLPLTDKEEKDYHGYGTRSIKYMVEKYHGLFWMLQENDSFVFIAVFPLRDDKSLEKESEP